jgi:hypothetical protein
MHDPGAAPCARTSAAACCAPARERRYVTATSQPSSASTPTTAAPIPLDPPITAAVRPSSSRSIRAFLSWPRHVAMKSGRATYRKIASRGPSGLQARMLDLPRVRWSVGEGRVSVVPGPLACATGSDTAAGFRHDRQEQCRPVGIRELGEGRRARGRARPRFPRTLSRLELGPLDQSSSEPLARAAATPGCAVALLAWGCLARAGLGR